MRRLLCLMAILLAAPAWAGALANGQLLYAPVYSHIYTGNKQRPFDLAVTLSVRNSDPRHAIRVLSVDYFSSDGKLLRSFLQSPMNLAPLQATEFVINESDTSGGSGASFLVRWNAQGPVNVPVVETVMIGTSGSQGISFLSPARVIEE